jgi:hypothetical protein
MGIIDVDAYVLPTLGKISGGLNYTAYVDLDIDKHILKYGSVEHVVRVHCYSPEKLSEGELERVARAFDTSFFRYFADVGKIRRIFRYWRWMGLLCYIIATFLAVSSYLFLPHPYNIFSTCIDIFFFHILIFGHCFRPLYRWIRDGSIERGVHKTIKRMRRCEVVEGEDEGKLRLVEMVRTHFSKIDGGEIGLYERMREYARNLGFQPAVKFYDWLIGELREEESFYTKYNPASLWRRIKLYYLGFKVEVPKIVAPIRNMDVRT